MSADIQKAKPMSALKYEKNKVILEKINEPFKFAKCSPLKNSFVILLLAFSYTLCLPIDLLWYVLVVIKTNSVIKKQTVETHRGVNYEYIEILPERITEKNFHYFAIDICKFVFEGRNCQRKNIYWIKIKWDFIKFVFEWHQMPFIRIRWHWKRRSKIK